MNVGCKVNRVEIDDIAAELIAAGADLVDDGSADAVIVNTCTVTGEAEKKTRKAVRRVLGSNARAKVYVTGCAAALDPDEFIAMDARVRVAGKSSLAAMIRSELMGGAPSVAGHPGLRLGGGFCNRVGIKVQDGCDNACTYCIVHVARGHSSSVPLPQVVEEARRYAAAGARELVLTGINLGAYESEGAHLSDLVLRLLGEIGAARLRISSIEPRDVDERLIEVMASAEGAVCRHLHLPLQSGSSKVLREMARPYDADGYLALVERLRAAMPMVSLSTDIIVGFPGETNDDFASTLALAEAAHFSRIHVFRYSKRAGTPAAARADQVESAVALERARLLSACGTRLSMDDARRRIGTREYVLVEEGRKGTTESYHEVRFAKSSADVGSLVDCNLTELSSDGMFVV